MHDCTEATARAPAETDGRPHPADSDEDSWLLLYGSPMHLPVADLDAITCGGWELPAGGAQYLSASDDGREVEQSSESDASVIYPLGPVAISSSFSASAKQQLLKFERPTTLTKLTNVLGALAAGAEVVEQQALMLSALSEFTSQLRFQQQRQAKSCNRYVV